MALVARYADKHNRKTNQGPRSTSEERKEKNKETYINYLETQLEKVNNNIII